VALVEVQRFAGEAPQDRQSGQLPTGVAARIRAAIRRAGASARHGAWE
jgi:hypothetical protein